MADSYYAISQIANDSFMHGRLIACTTQQQHLGNVVIVGDAGVWVSTNRYLWAASPSWGEKWDYALASHPNDTTYSPGADSAVITDGDILATVQALGAPPPDPPQPEVTPLKAD